MDGSSGSATSSKECRFSLRRTKRFYSLEDLTIGKIEPSSPAPSAPSYRTHETTVGIEASDLYPEDSLARETVQLALVLEKFKAKIKSHTSKKSSQILTSAANKLFVKLQDVESEIQTDLLKFAGVTKLKRKHLEARFEEQQDQLRIVHDKFKENVNQHLLDYKNTIEDFQADQMELKTNLERQSRRNYILLFNLI
ncbi:putative meiosis-specific protein ASY3 [Dioscorea sansibarensis]